MNDAKHQPNVIDSLNLGERKLNSGGDLTRTCKTLKTIALHHLYDKAALFVTASNHKMKITSSNKMAVILLCS